MDLKFFPTTYKTLFQLFQTQMTNGDYMAIFTQVLLPVANEVSAVISNKLQ